MSMFFRFAAAAAVATSAIALYDAAHHGITGRYSQFSDDSTMPALADVGGVIHGLNYAVLTIILVLLARAATTRAQRRLAHLLAGAIGALAVSFLIIDPITTATGLAPAVEAFSNVTGIAFLLMFLLAFLLGLALRSRVELRVPAILLIGIGPVVLLTVLLGTLGSGYAHPAYAETLVNLGILMLALPANHTQPKRTLTADHNPVPA